MKQTMISRQSILLQIVLVTILLAQVAVAESSRPSTLPPKHKEKDLPAEIRSRPLVIYSQSYTSPCFADYVPCAREVTAPFEIAMARNEYEPMQIGIYVPSSAKALRNIRLEVECDIPSQAGHIYYQPSKELPGEKGKRWQGKRDDLPLYVIPSRTISRLEPGRSGAFWVTFKTDASVAAGRHIGTAKVIVGHHVVQ